MYYTFVCTYVCKNCYESACIQSFGKIQNASCKKSDCAVYCVRDCVYRHSRCVEVVTFFPLVPLCPELFSDSESGCGAFVVGYLIDLCPVGS